MRDSMYKVCSFSGFWPALLAFACFLAGGCETVGDMFRERKPVDAAVVATWWDGPRIRPGVRLLIQVGTPAAPPALAVSALIM